MKISNIDEDFIDIIDYLNEKGYKPYASCDGVLEHHAKDADVLGAYINFLESEDIIKLMAAFYRDEDTFNIVMGNATHIEPFELYGNMISGNNYAVHFNNDYGQTTEYFKKIIDCVCEKKIEIKKEEIEFFKKINQVLKEDNESDLSILIDLNSQMRTRNGEIKNINQICIETKDDCDYDRNLEQFKKLLLEQKNLKDLDNDSEQNENTQDKNTCGCTIIGNTFLFILFEENDLDMIIDFIRTSRKIGKQVDKCEKIEIDDFDFDDFDDFDFDDIDDFEK